MSNDAPKIEIRGKTIDNHTRCVHYHSPLDIIAIKFKCCGQYYPCHQCHEEEAGHAAKVWKKEEWNNKAILCGICKNEMSVHQYINSGDLCPYCNTSFNPGCRLHYHLYFEV